MSKTLDQVIEKASGNRASHTLSERMRHDERVPMKYVDEVAALEARINKMELWVGRAMQELSPTDTLKHNYEKLGLSNALVVEKKYGKRSAFGYMGREW